MLSYTGAPLAGRLKHGGTRPDKPAGEDFSRSLKQLEEEFERAQGQDRARKTGPRHAHQSSKLGDPKWEEKAKDGRFDRPEDEDEGEARTRRGGRFLNKVFRKAEIASRMALR